MEIIGYLKCPFSIPQATPWYYPTVKELKKGKKKETHTQNSFDNDLKELIIIPKICIKEMIFGTPVLI